MLVVLAFTILLHINNNMSIQTFHGIDAFLCKFNTKEHYQSECFESVLNDMKMHRRHDVLTVIMSGGSGLFIAHVNICFRVTLHTTWPKE